MAQQFTATVSLSSDATTVAFVDQSTAATAFRPNYLRIDASTLNTAFLNFSSTVIATTASSLGYPFTSGAAALVFGSPSAPFVNGLTSRFTAVTSAGGTTVIRVLAVRI